MREWFLSLSLIRQALVATGFTWLAFAAGAMIYVVVEELIPESHRAGNEDRATMSLMAAFTVMMVLDVSLG